METFTASYPLLPIDGFTFETRCGIFTASVVTPPSETLNPNDSQKVEIEVCLARHDVRLTRRLTLHVSPKDLMGDLPGVMRLINGWVFLDPGAENYFASEMDYGQIKACRSLLAQ